MTTPPFQPLQGYLLCRDVKNIGELQTYLVVAAGPGSWNPVTGMTGPQYAEAGQTVVVRKGAATSIPIRDQPYYIINMADLIGVLKINPGDEQ